MLFVVRLLLIMLIYMPLFASNHDYEAYAKQLAEQQKIDANKLEKIANELSFISGKLPKTGGGCEKCQSQVTNVSFKEPNMENGIIVFVSFSMPKLSLIELSDQSEKYGATLILRGIYRNSFTKTKDKILEINKNGLRLNVDPQLFRQYNIEKVPTFVLLKNGREIARLSGNVSLEFARNKLNEVVQ